MILVRRISGEEAKLVLHFFEQNPERDNCIIGLGSPSCIIEHTRADIPKLQKIAADHPDVPTSEQAARLSDGCKVKVSETCFVVEVRGREGVVVGNPPYPNNMPLVEIAGLRHTLPAKDLIM